MKIPNGLEHSPIALKTLNGLAFIFTLKKLSLGFMRS